MTTYRAYDLDHCVICKRELSEAMREHAHRRFEEMTCSSECRAVQTKRHFACCEQAEFTPCVCMYSFTCKEHGDTHIGTHD